MTKEEILKNCTIDGNIVKLPEIRLDREMYLQVAQSLQLIGGKWNRKSQGFLFPSDPTDLLTQVANGEKRNLKKEFQFFQTPVPLSDYLVDLADLKEGFSILEPSAGQGSIVSAIHRRFPDIIVDCCELMEINREFLYRWFNFENVNTL
jgi:hypothetical protein